MKVKVIRNTQTGSDSIKHLIGKVFDVHIIDKDGVNILHDGHILPLNENEYEIFK